MENNERTKQLLIIGNGFDLACGLKSRYNDFFYDLYKENPQNYSITEEENYWFKLFKGMVKFDENYTLGWTDIELQILIELMNIEFIYNIDLLLNLNTLESKDSIKAYISRFIYTKSNENKHYDEDSVLNTFLVLKKTLHEHEIDILDKRSTFDRLKKDLKKFENTFAFYLNNELERNGDDYLINSSRLFDRLLLQNHLSNKSRNYQYNRTDIGDNTQQIISFNYTQPSLYDSIRYIHGNLKNRNIIFGIDYDSVSNLFNYHPLEFTKSYRILENKLNSKVSISSDIKNILFYGHGLGEADYSYFQSIFDTVDLYHSDAKLIFYWTQFGDQDQYIEQVEKVVWLIEKYGQTFANKDHGRNLFTKLLLENRIIFEEIVANEI
ncbi:AbiH family protein [Granulicatella adiacens]